MLTLLHARVQSLTGCGKLQDMAVYLTEQAARPYLATLLQWLTQGTIHDPYSEVGEGGIHDPNSGLREGYCYAMWVRQLEYCCPHFSISSPCLNFISAFNIHSG